MGNPETENEMLQKGRPRGGARAIAPSDGEGSGSVSVGRRARAARRATWLSAALLLAACVSACGDASAGAKGDTPRDEPRDSAVTAAEGASGEAARPASAAAPVRVVFVGTSLTAGLGLDPDSAFPALLQRKADSARIPVRVVNAGVSGETSAGALRRIDWVLRQPADVVVLETGANDGLRALPVAATRSNIERIVRRIRAVRPAAHVLLVQMEAPPNLGDAYTTAFHAMFPAVAQAEQVNLAAFLLDGVAGVASLNQADGIHPNEEGARRVADNLWTALEPVLRVAAGVPKAGS